MFEQHSVNKYLKHQARCIEAQLGEEDRHCFFVGTYTPQPENELHLVEFIEETNEIYTRNVFNHPNEIYSISSCPTNPSLLFTTHRGGFMDDILKNTPKPTKSTEKKDDNNNDNNNNKNESIKDDNKDNNDDKTDKTDKNDSDEKDEKNDNDKKEDKDNPNLYKATLWRLIGQDSSDNLDNNNDLTDELNEDEFNISNSLNSKHLRLQPMFTLPTRSVILGNKVELSTHTVLWDGMGVTSHIMSLSDNCIQFWKFGDKYSCIKEDKCIYDEDRLYKLISGVWDPHYPNRFISTNNTTIRVWEAKDLKEIQTIENAHKACILSVDHNPNKPYHIVTSSEDRTIKFWDLRNSKKALKILSNHSHWIWCVKYNRYHDQLIISSGSDSNVSLWNIVSVSSAPLGELEDNSKEEDKLIKTYREHEESVYWSSWSANNAWVFASLSYDGRVVINHVPAATKYRILL